MELLIDVLKHDLSLPLLLAARQLDEMSFTEIVHLLERFVFRYIVCSHQHPGKLEQIYLSEAIEIRKNPAGYKIGSLIEKLRTLQNTDATDGVFIPSMLQEMAYKQRSGNRVLKYFLATIEHYLDWWLKGAQGAPKCIDKTTIFDLSQLQVEHIYPQNAVAKDNDLEPEKHKLENLTFWGPSDNSAAGNADFPTKSKSYGQSKVALNRELPLYGNWDRSTLEARRKVLEARASAIFRII